MRVLMQLPTRATLEWRATGGLVGLTIEDETDTEAHFVVYLGADDTDPIEGSLTQVLAKGETLLTNKTVGEKFIETLQRVADELLTQPIPTAKFDRLDLDRERLAVRDRRRDWLLKEIADGNYAAIGLLKQEFGENVRINVEIVGAA